MNIRKIFAEKKTTFSFEFFPPKTDEASERLFETIKQLTPLGPSFVSVTYGAGGTTRGRTHDLVVRLHRETDLTIVPHLTCVGSSREEIHEIIGEYKDAGIENIFALRGDPPKGSVDFIQPENGFAYATELVAFIKEHYPSMGIGVAGFPEGHPATPNRLIELDFLKEKIDAGADYICTQMFFDNHEFYDFRERCVLAGITVPIIAGIMPITSKKGMKRMAELSLGTRFPASLLRSIDRIENDEMVANAGVHWASEQVRDLLHNGVKGIHFYTLNNSSSTLQIYKSLGVTHSEQLIAQ
ncbi:MAG: methylenetetrahydrofolate reductase [NAD(P)H] [Spirochaetota bacterium]